MVALEGYPHPQMRFCIREKRSPAKKGAHEIVSVFDIETQRLSAHGERPCVEKTANSRDCSFDRMPRVAVGPGEKELGPIPTSFYAGYAGRGYLLFCQMSLSFSHIGCALGSGSSEGQASGM